MLTLKKSISKLSVAHRTVAVDKRIKNLSSTSSNTIRSSLKLYTNEGYIFVKYDDIIYCKALGNYAEIFFYENDQLKSHVVSKSLKAIETELPSDAFSRCHQSYLIPHDKIKCLTRHSSILLTTGTELPVSRRMKKRLLELL